jgi:hypothetical protein
MSLLGNILVIGSALTCILAPQILRRAAPDLISGENWWALLAAALAIAVYMASLRAAGAVFSGRRERLLAVLEGKA